MPRPVIIAALRSPPPGLLALALALVVGLAVAVRGTLRHVVVAGPSMRPSLEPGDRLVLLSVPGRPRVGDLVTTPDPRAPHRILLKRVHATGDHLIDVRGDNAVASTDSRMFGAVPITSVRRCVGWRYLGGDGPALVGRRARRPWLGVRRSRGAVGGAVSWRRARAGPRRSRRRGRR